MIRVRRAKIDNEEACTIKTLKQWTRSGELLGTDLVFVDSEWIPANQYSELSGVFAATVWDLPEDSVWSPSLPPNPVLKTTENSKQDAATVESKVVPKLPLSAIEPLDVPPIRTAQKEQTTLLDESSVSQPSTSIVEDYQRSKPSPTSTVSQDVPTNTSSSGQSKEQPEPSTSSKLMNSNVNIHGTPKDLNEMWNPEMDLKDQPGLWADVAPPPKSKFSWFRLSLLVIPGAFAIFLARSFVISEAQTEFPLDMSVTENASVPNELVTDSLLELEDRLKSKLRRDTQMVSPEQSLSDALRVDLEYVGLDIVRLDSKVLTWTGRKLDQPKSASIKVYLNPSENFEEDLLLASMVIAKYAVRYFLEMDSFDVFLKMEEVYIQKTIQTEQARFLLVQPGSLKSFMLSLSANSD